MDHAELRTTVATHASLCHFIKVTALGFNQEKVALAVYCGHYRPFLLNYGGCPRFELRAMLQNQNHPALIASNACNSRSDTLFKTQSAHYISPQFNGAKVPVFIAQICECELQVHLMVYIPGLKKQVVSAQAIKLLEVASQQFLLNLKLQRQIQQQHGTPGNHNQDLEIAHQTVEPYRQVAKSPPPPRIWPRQHLTELESRPHPHWAELFSELQACLSFDQLNSLLETYLPPFLAQYAARLVTLSQGHKSFVVIAQWGNYQEMIDLEPECRFSGAILNQNPYGLRTCCQCYPSQQTDPQFMCIVLGVIEQKAYVLQLFLKSDNNLSAEQIDLIQHLTKQLQAVMKRLQLFAELQTKALQDPLTGLKNRRYMQSMLENICLNASPGFQISVILIDIDFFKQVNDTYGHQAGDAVLKDISIVLKGHVRTKDMVCRYGGEEFCMILLDTTLDVTLKRAEKIRRAVKYLNLAFAGQSIGPLTISIGIAQFPLHGQTPDTLIAKADKALYWAKNNGRDQTVSFEHLLRMPESSLKKDRP